MLRRCDHEVVSLEESLISVYNAIGQDWITAQKRKHMAAVIQGSKVAKFLDR